MSICFLNDCIPSSQDLHSTYGATQNNEKSQNAKGNLRLLLTFLRETISENFKLCSLLSLLDVSLSQMLHQELLPF